MSAEYKPNGYNSVSPYLVVDEPQRLVDLLKKIFDVTELRRFENDNGVIQHLELRIDDSVIMLSTSTKDWPANTTLFHVYVPDVFKTFDLAVEHGCKAMEQPVNKPGDPDTRGGFMDFAGNYWAIGQQKINT